VDPSQLIGNLSPDYRFEKLEALHGNEVAVETVKGALASEIVAPGLIVLHGNPGLGKTHLLQAACHEALGQGHRVAYLPANDFTTMFTGAVRDRTVDRMQDALRDCHVIAIDEYQALAGRQGTQDHLADTIEAMMNLGRLVLLAGESSPLEAGLSGRLLRRMLGALQVEVEPMEPLERRMLVLAFARQAGQSLPQWAVDRLATTESCTRALRGAVLWAIQYAKANRLTAEKLEAHLTASALTLVSSPVAPSPSALLALVANQFVLGIEELTGRGREARVTEPRAIASALLARHGISHAAIGEFLAGRDRGTVRDLVQRGERLLAERPDLAERIGA
jgi:chromosomal replication initiator protein